MASIIRDLIAALRKPQTKSAELALALSNARVAAQEIDGQLREASAAYKAGLLDLDAAQLKVLAERRSAVEVDRDRAQQLIGALEERLAETEAAEAEATFQAERAAVDAEAERVAHLIRTRYPKLAGELVDLLKQISKADRAVAAMNGQIERRGRGEAGLPDVQRRGLPQPATSHTVPPSIWGNTRLEEIEGFAPGWEVTMYNVGTI